MDTPQAQNPTQMMSEEELRETMNYSEAVRMMYHDEITNNGQEGAEELVLTNLGSPTAAWRTTTNLASNGQINMQRMEIALHDQWYKNILAAKHIPPTSRVQDTLVSHLLAIKTTGDIRSRVSPENVIVCSDGRRLWADLPLFAPDLIDEFASRYYQPQSYTAQNRENMAAFVGRLVAVGIYDGPALCMLSLFREALETPRPLTGKGASAQQLPLQELLSALEKMLQYIDLAVVILSHNTPGAAAAAAANNYGNFPQLSALGELAQQAVPHSSPGYSPQRFNFWIQRLREIETCGNKRIVELAKECLDTMGNPHHLGLGPSTSS